MAAIEIHPDEATARHLADGDQVTIEVGGGSIHTALRVSPGVRPGIAVMEGNGGAARGPR